MSAADATPRVVLVVAVADNGVIGKGGGLPWHLPADLRHFQTVTMGRTILMGRRTWASLAQPLKGRDNWVLTRDPAFTAAGARVFHDFDAALAACDGELFVIGGAQVFERALPLATDMELTRVHATPAGDTWFPAFDEVEWKPVWRDEHPADERNRHACTFLRLEKRRARLRS